MAKSSINQTKVTFWLLIAAIVFGLLVLILPAIPSDTVDALYLTAVVAWFAGVKSFIEANWMILLLLVSLIVGLYFYSRKGRR